MLISLLAAAGVAVAAPAAKPEKLTLKAGQAVTFAARIEDGKVVLGPARRGSFGKMEPKAGEITVGLSTRDKDLYDQLVTVEKTSAPIDFVATGLIGEIMIDEREVKGLLGAPITQRIGGTSWTVWLHEFEAGKAAPAAK
jgi:hypothetical protein